MYWGVGVPHHQKQRTLTFPMFPITIPLRFPTKLCAVDGIRSPVTSQTSIIAYNISRATGPAAVMLLPWLGSQSYRAREERQKARNYRCQEFNNEKEQVSHRAFMCGCSAR